MEVILNNRQLTAQEAERFGLVNRVYPVEFYLQEALKLALEIAGRAPVAVQMAKDSINKAYESTLREGLAAERRNFYFLFATEDQKEGMTAFIEKREAKWKGQ
jgi:enoyl-CoA hydratase